MNTFWFLLTLIIDIIPFVILSTFLLKEYLPCSFPILLGIEQTKRVRHDIKHHIRAIERLIEEQRIPEIKEYLKEYGQIFITIDNQFDGIVRSKEGTMLSGKRDYKKTVMETYPWMLWLPNIRDR